MRTALRCETVITAVRSELPCIVVVGQIRLEAFVDYPGLELAIEYRESNFDSAKEVAAHPIGACEINVVVPVVVEIPDAMMLEKAAENRSHPNIVGHPRDAGAQCARASNDQVDLHTGARCGVQRVDHGLLDQCVHLGDDLRPLALLG